MERIAHIFRSGHYQAVETEPEAVPSLGSAAVDEVEGVDLPGRSLFARKCARVALSVLITTNIVLFLISVFNASWRWESCHAAAASSKPEIDGSYHRHGLNRALKETSAYSPVLDQLELRLESKTFNGLLRDNSSIWRKPPSEEVDAAWDYISTEGLELITVSSNDLAKSGKDPSVCVKAPTSWHAGPDAYVAQIDVFHQIHCLNELRKEIHYGYYYESPPDELHKSHKAHCVHMLLQSLMCAADVGIISHNWVHNDRVAEPKNRPMADFNMVKKCRDFESLLDWARERAVKDLPRKWPLLKWEPGMPIVPGEGYAK